MTIPSTGQEIKYRPFVVREEKVLLTAIESDDAQQISNAISGAAGIFFPKNDAANGTTTATKKVTRGGTGIGRQDIGT